MWIRGLLNATFLASSSVLDLDHAIGGHVVDARGSSRNSFNAAKDAREEPLNLSGTESEAWGRPFKEVWDDYVEDDLDIVERDLKKAAYLNNTKVLDAPLTHPFWIFEVEYLKRVLTYICCIVMFFAGVLCSAGGIGGGGIYVTVLMVVGGLHTHEAVPLSKGIVFWGSLVSLVLNLRQSFSQEAKSAKPLINYNICRLVVPSSLFGTYMGVFLNTTLPDWLILGFLLLVLLAILVSMTRSFLQQYKKEKEAMAEQAELGLPPAQPPVPPPPSPPSEARPPSRGRAFQSARRSIPPNEDEGEQPLHSARSDKKDSVHSTASTDTSTSVISSSTASLSSRRTGSKEVSTATSQLADGRKRSTLTARPKRLLSISDCVIVTTLEVFIVTFGILRYHISKCDGTKEAADQISCHHPSLFWLPGTTLHRWLRHAEIGVMLEDIAFAVPLSCCGLVVIYYNWFLITRESWPAAESVAYSAMAAITGCLSGLVGIGGGLVFSPFFLIMGVDPAIAVATSSTCVIFTSSSTFFQYFLTDRVVLSLAVIYGTLNFVSSYVGTSLVLALQGRPGARKSYITLTVAFGVALSTILALIKLITICVTRW